jgi:hypothetical protein
MKGKRIELLTANEKGTMMSECAKTSTPLYDFISYVDNESMVAPLTVQDLLLSLSSASPVCSYMHVNPYVRRLMDALKAGVNLKDDPEHWKNLREHIPVMYGLVDNSSVTAIPHSLVNLILELWNRAERTFSGVLPHVEEAAVIEEEELSFFPSLPKIRSRGSYTADISKTLKVANSCKKNYTGHPTLLPGIFTVYCRHGKL